MAEEKRDANEILASWNPPPVDTGYERTVGVELPPGDTRATAAFGSDQYGKPAPDADFNSEDYEENSVPALKAEIDRRNEGRDDEDKISKAGNKADLIEALEEDDEND